jgi:hypothetical protein
LKSYFCANRVQIDESHAVDAVVRIGRTMDMYRRHEIGRETPPVEVASLVRT